MILYRVYYDVFKYIIMQVSSITNEFIILCETIFKQVEQKPVIPKKE